MRVDREVSGPQALADPQGTGHVTRPDRPGQAVLRRVGQPYGVRLVVEGQHHGDRSEDLVDGDRGVRRHPGEDGRRVPEPRAVGRRSEDGPYAVGQHVHEPAHALPLDGRDQRPHLGLLVRRVADHHGRDGRCQQVEEAVVDRALDQDAGPGAAVLAGVVQEGHRGGGRRGLQVGVGEDHVGALAAELQGEALHAIGAAGHDVLAGPGGAGEDDLGHTGVVHQGGSGHRTLARQHLEQPGGQPGLQGQFRQAQCGQRCGLGGFEQDGVAGGECRGRAPGGDRHREVPGGDDTDDAERFQDGEVDAAGDRDLPAQQAFDTARAVVEEIAHIARLPAGVADGVTGLADLGEGQFLDVFVDDGGEPAQQPGAVGGCRRGPDALGGGGAGDGRVDVGGGGGRDGGDDLGGGRVQDVQAVWCGLLGHVRASIGSEGRGGGHRRSKERRSSQSVTAAS